MSYEQFVSVIFKPATLAMIGQIDAIVQEYQHAGYVMTVRQLYYQLVARGLVENTLQSYKRIAGLVNDGRLAGLIDWKGIEDRTRDFVKRGRWASGGEILHAVAAQFHMDMWDNQDRRVFVIVEKEALVGVLERTCKNYDVPLLAARGYPSASVLYDFAKADLDSSALILHLGDHDPSGLDMSRDLSARLKMFSYNGDFELKRIALNMNQVDELKPPPNPAKTTDARFHDYAQRYGGESWELDALPPDYLVHLVESHINDEIDFSAWTEKTEEIEEVKRKLHTLAENFDA